MTLVKVLKNDVIVAKIKVKIRIFKIKFLLINFFYTGTITWHNFF